MSIVLVYIIRFVNFIALHTSRWKLEVLSEIFTNIKGVLWKSFIIMKKALDMEETKLGQIGLSPSLSA